MKTEVNRGDFVTFAETGTAKFDFGDKDKVTTARFDRGETWMAPAPGVISGIAVVVSPARADRVEVKRSGRHQAMRSCFTSITSLEWPDLVDPIERDLESKLKARGDDLKGRLVEYSARLRGEVST